MSAGNFFQSVRDSRSERPLGFYGQFDRTHDFRSITGINQASQAAQVTTLSIPAAPDNSTTYRVTIGGVACEYTTDASATQAELGAGIAAAINNRAGARALMSAAYAGGTLTLTGVWPGIVVTVTRNNDETTQDIGAPTNTTTAASASAVEFGLVCATDGYVTNEGVKKVFVPTTATFTAQVITLTFAGNTGSYYHGTVQINGKTYPWGGVVWDTNLATTLTAIAAAINAVMPAETVIADGSSGTVITLTAEVEGAEFDADAHAQGHADAEATKAYTTGPSLSTSLKRAFVGMSVRRLDVENQTVDGDDPAYGANEGVEVCTRGLGWVQRDTSETWTHGQEVYVSLASATKGRIYNTASTDRVWLPSDLLRIERQENSTTSDGLGRISVKGA